MSVGRAEHTVVHGASHHGRRRALVSWKAAVVLLAAVWRSKAFSPLVVVTNPALAVLVNAVGFQLYLPVIRTSSETFLSSHEKISPETERVFRLMRHKTSRPPRRFSAHARKRHVEANARN